MKVSWLPEFAVPDGRIGLTHLPGDIAPLDADLRSLRTSGVSHLVCFVEEHELARLEPPESLTARGRAVQDAGIAFLHVPIEDFQAPTPAQVSATVQFIDEALGAGGTVVLHCWAGLGRAGTLAACWLVHQGQSAADAITTVRWVRPGAIQSQAQVDAIVAATPFSATPSTMATSSEAPAGA